ncbi:possible heptosyltransferase [Nonlabens ulvanivorans]|nr:hypothetical protein [Nonlabens ulvanivorans]GAK90617.1 possible heptosyltransferase [Nonlabens ulvanivorans]
MASSKKVNNYRRKIMKSLTRKLENSHEPMPGDLKDLANIKRVLIVRTNHRLGNLVLITPLVQEVIRTFPNAKIDLIVQGFLGPVIFENYDAVDHIIRLPKKPFKNLKDYIKGATSVRKHKYDFAINAVIGSSSGDCIHKWPELSIKSLEKKDKTLLNSLKMDVISQKNKSMPSEPIWND